MKISIAMATYNGAQYIEEQLQSFANQTRLPDELIITDDCSSDKTEEIVLEFTKTAPFPVKYFRNKERLGYCGNFNSALIKTSGDLVFLSDQDDVWFPDKIDYVFGIAERNQNALVVMNDASLTDGDLNEVGLTKLGQIRSAGLSQSLFVMGCCCAIRREFLMFCIPIPEGVKSHDKWIVELADDLNGKLVDQRILQYYRRHESNESQFIANRTTRVTRGHVWLFSINRSLNKIVDILFSNRRGKEKEWIAEQKLMINNLSHVLSAAPKKYQKDIQEKITKSKEKLEAYETRVSIRRRWLIPRFFATFEHLLKGGYQGSHVFKSLLRDLIG